MKIAISSLGHPFNANTWSGIPAHISLALLQIGHQVEPVELMPFKEPWHYNWQRRWFLYVFKKWFLSSVQQKVLKNIGQQLDRRIQEINPDVVIIIHGDFLAYTTFKNLACIIHDTTFQSILNYYSAFTNLTPGSVKAGNKMYSLALERADAAVFSSRWASNSAVNFYGVQNSKVHTIPFGANLKKLPSDEDVESWITQRGQSKTLQFLFIGVDWKRKGGPETMVFISELNKIGVKSKLVVIGCNPSIEDDMAEFVEVVGFLNKNRASDNQYLEQVLRESVALILPSKAECYGCVYCEANAYGLPAIGRDTGGVSEIIKDGHNGFLISSTTSPAKLAKKWKDLWLANNNYIEMARAARREYLERLNYEVFAKKLNEIFEELLEKKNTHKHV